MACGLPVFACNSGGPTESVISYPVDERTGWSKPPEPEVWAQVLAEIVALPISEREAMANRARERARKLFGMDAMAHRLEDALRETVLMSDVVDEFGWVGTLELVGFLIGIPCGAISFSYKFRLGIFYLNIRYFIELALY